MILGASVSKEPDRWRFWGGVGLSMIGTKQEGLPKTVKWK